MRDRSSGSMITVTMITVILAAAAVAALSLPPAMAQAPDKLPAKSGAAQNSAVKTPWGEPDLQGIWTDETDTPLQRPPQYANLEFFTAAQREELDRDRSALLRRDKRVERGTELDVAGAYNGLFQSYKRSGARTSMIVAPSDGLIPAMTPEAQKIIVADRQFRLPCCKRPRPASRNQWHAAAEDMIQRPRQGSPSLRHATTQRG
jgi:hypothetical protein